MTVTTAAFSAVDTLYRPARKGEACGAAARGVTTNSSRHEPESLYRETCPALRHDLPTGARMSVGIDFRQCLRPLWALRLDVRSKRIPSGRPTAGTGEPLSNRCTTGPARTGRHVPENEAGGVTRRRAALTYDNCSQCNETGTSRAHMIED